jgi:hypothetical protein
LIAKTFTSITGFFTEKNGKESNTQCHRITEHMSCIRDQRQAISHIATDKLCHHKYGDQDKTDGQDFFIIGDMAMVVVMLMIVLISCMVV